MKKFLALALVLVMLAAIPLSTSASSAYDSYVVGTWTGYARIDTKTNDIGASGSTTLTLRSNGTCTWYFAGQSFTGTWKYYSKESSGYAYQMSCTVYGTKTTFAFMYSTLPNLYGDLAILVGDAIYIYQK